MSASISAAPTVDRPSPMGTPPEASDTRRRCPTTRRARGAPGASILIVARHLAAEPIGGVGEAARAVAAPLAAVTPRDARDLRGRHARAEEGVGGALRGAAPVAERAELAREPGQRSVEDPLKACSGERRRPARWERWGARGTPGTRRARPGTRTARCRPRRGAPGASRAGPTARTSPGGSGACSGRRTRLSRTARAHDAAGEARGRGAERAHAGPVVAERARARGDERRERGGDEERREASAGEAAWRRRSRERGRRGGCVRGGGGGAALERARTGVTWGRGGRGGRRDEGVRRDAHDARPRTRDARRRRVQGRERAGREPSAR